MEIIIFYFVLWYFIKGFKTVNANEAIVIERRGVYLRTAYMNTFINPFTDKVKAVVNIGLQGIKVPNIEISTNDFKKVYINANIFWQVTSPVNFLNTKVSRMNDEIDYVLSGAMKQVFSSYNASELTTKSMNFEQHKIREIANKTCQISGYEIKSIHLTSINHSENETPNNRYKIYGKSSNTNTNIYKNNVNSKKSVSSKKSNVERQTMNREQIQERMVKEISQNGNKYTTEEIAKTISTTGATSNYAYGEMNRTNRRETTIHKNPTGTIRKETIIRKTPTELLRKETIIRKTPNEPLRNENTIRKTQIESLRKDTTARNTSTVINPRRENLIRRAESKAKEKEKELSRPHYAYGNIKKSKETYGSINDSERKSPSLHSSYAFLIKAIVKKFSNQYEIEFGEDCDKVQIDPNKKPWENSGFNERYKRDCKEVLQKHYEKLIEECGKDEFKLKYKTTIKEILKLKGYELVSIDFEEKQARNRYADYM